MCPGFPGERARRNARPSRRLRSIATALDGHCRTLRRLEVGPFHVDEADPGRLLDAGETFDRLPQRARAQAPKDALRRMGRG